MTRMTGVVGCGLVKSIKPIGLTPHFILFRKSTFQGVWKYPGGGQQECGQILNTNYLRDLILLPHWLSVAWCFFPAPPHGLKRCNMD